MWSRSAAMSIDEEAEKDEDASDLEEVPIPKDEN